MKLAPDIILGYANGYRISDQAVLGEFPQGLIGNRTDKWSADHCMYYSVVPGVLLSNRELVGKNPAIWDLAPTLLSLFEIPIPHVMDGASLLKA